MFIVFEGLDGCGKTTQIELLENKLKEDGIKSSIAKFLTDDVTNSIVKTMNAEVGDAIFIVADKNSVVFQSLAINLSEKPKTFACLSVSKSWEVLRVVSISIIFLIDSRKNEVILVISWISSMVAPRAISSAIAKMLSSLNSLI